MKALVGTYSRHGGSGLCQLEWELGRSTEVSTLAPFADPSFLALGADGFRVYAVLETKPGAVADLLAAQRGWSVGSSSASGGDSPCHLALHPSGRWLAIAHYNSASIALFALDSRGEFSSAPVTVAYVGRSIHPLRQQRPHPHAVYWCDAGRELWVPDLGADCVRRHRFDAEHGELSAELPPLHLSAGSGPRHFAFHTSGRVAYVLNELNSTLVTLRANANMARWDISAVNSTCVVSVTGNAPAEIALHPNGRRLYCSNRGDDSIAEFSISALDATVVLERCTPTGGHHPRHFTLTSDCSHLLVANQHSGTITALSLNPAGDIVGAAEVIARLPAPNCLLLLS